MIIRRKPGKTVYWGDDGVLRLEDLPATCTGWLKTLELHDGRVVAQAHGQNVRLAEVGQRLHLGPVVATLEKIGGGEAHWDFRAPREIRILRDDARRG